MFGWLRYAYFFFRGGKFSRSSFNVLTARKRNSIETSAHAELILRKNFKLRSERRAFCENAAQTETFEVNRHVMKNFSQKMPALRPYFLEGTRQGIGLLGKIELVTDEVETKKSLTYEPSRVTPVVQIFQSSK